MRPSSRTLVPVLTLVVVGLLAVPVGGDAATRKKPTRPVCALKHAETVASSRFGKLLATHRETDELYGDSTEVYACRTGRTPVQVDSYETGMGVTIGDVVFTTNYVAYSFSTLSSQCTKYMGDAPECRGAGAASYNTRTGKPRTDVGSAVNGLALSDHGWLAWIAPSADGTSWAVVAEDRRGRRTLAPDHVDPASLKIAGTTVSWTRGGAPESGPLG